LVARTVRESTIVSHRENVERAIDLMRSDVCAPLCLTDLARVARMSEFHFTRVFHGSTGLPPFRFLSALRLARARDLLVNTDESVIEICLNVGYSSIGTFTRRFTELVGVSPVRLRHYARAAHTLPTVYSHPDSTATVCVHLKSPEPAEPVVVAAFDTSLPFGRPAAYALVSEGCMATMGLAFGRYYVLAFARQDRIGMSEPLALFDIGLATQGDVIVELRRIVPTDPPLLSFVPFILCRRNKTDSRCPIGTDVRAAE